CALRGTKNLLAHLGMIDAPVVPQTDVPVLPGEHAILPSIRANRNGMIRFEVEPGRFLTAGTIIARIVDVVGDELEAVGMTRDGSASTFPALSWAGAQAIATGDYVADLFS